LLIPNLLPKNNLVNYIDHDPIDIQNDTALAEVSVRGTGISSDPFILEEWKLSGITIEDTTKFFIIQNCLVEENGVILRNNSGSPKIMNNNITNVNNQPNQYANDYLNSAEDACVFLSYCDNSIIQNNTCVGEICLEYSNNPTITNNLCQTGGIYLNLCEEPSVENNIVLNSDFDGIHINHCLEALIENNTCIEGIRYGLAFYYSNYVLVTNNTFNEYNQHGICFASGNLQEQVSHNEISRNILRNNSNYGIKINIISSNNTFHHNSFIDNGNLPQAYDSSANDNTWYDPTTKEGNYWSDLTECESYTLAGEDDKVSDRYPLDENLIIYCERNISFNISSFLLIGALSLISVSIFIIKRKLIELQ